MTSRSDEAGHVESSERSVWLQPRRWVELILVAWAVGVGVHYYRTMGFIDLIRDMLGGGG